RRITRTSRHIGKTQTSKQSGVSTAPIRKIAVSQGEVRASQSVAPPRETRVVGILLGGSAEGGLPSFGMIVTYFLMSNHFRGLLLL
ncbi:MAG: hypothetical protein O2960_18340, partial [Verrucomicrobia bacterium]|nr:hypothetical protein [Verrucomicrobiota bacterium]